MVALGLEFDRPPVEDPLPAFDPGVQLLVELRGILAGLPEVIARVVADAQHPAPRPYVHVAEPDLSAIVTAVNGLKPGATAAEVGREVVRQLNPQPTTNDSAMVEAMRELVEKIDFRMQGVGRAFGSSGPSNISDNPQRQLGQVTIVNPGPNLTSGPTVVSVAGVDTPVYTPAAGRSTQLLWLGLFTPATNNSPTVATVKLGSELVYEIPLGTPGAFSHSARRVSLSQGDQLTVNLTVGAPVYVNVDANDV